jgi:hypothetical protein
MRGHRPAHGRDGSVVVMVAVAARDMHTAVLVIPMPSAVKVRSVRVAVHMTPVALTAARNMQLAVLMVSVPPAVEMRPARVAVYVAVMVPVPVISRLHVNVLGAMNNPILGRSKWVRRDRLCASRYERQPKNRTHEGECSDLCHSKSPVEHSDPVLSDI